MNTDSAPNAKGTGLFRSALFAYQKETGLPLILWALVALLNFTTQIVLRRELAPGEFGTLNTALGMIGLMLVPALAVKQAFRQYLARQDTGPNARIDSIRASALTVTETFAWAWGALCLLLAFLLLALIDLPRFSLELFTVMNVLVALGGLVSWALCENANQLRLWTGLLIASVLVRLFASAGLAGREPWAESGLASFLFAGFITLTPALRSRETDVAARWKACQAVCDRDFLLYVGATFSVLLGVFLFSSADRIVAQSWFGVATNNNMGMVDWIGFDAYQTAGLIARGLLWGTQPLLWIWFAQRSQLDRTNSGSLLFFWIYFGALLVGVVALFLVNHPLCRLFCGTEVVPHSLATTADLTSSFVPSLAVAMIPLGLLQALGIFSLASRRYHECFVMGGCAIGYTLVLYLAGRQPQLMPVYMFGGGLVCLMIVLFVGVVRWAQAAMNATHPVGLSVVMPLYNEGARINSNVEQTMAVLRMLGPFEMILVNDGSSDNSGEEITRLAEKYSGEVVSLQLSRSGKGEALRRGAQAARGEFVVFIDADLDLPPEQILFFVAIQRVKKADAVIGSKMHPDSTVDYPFIRRVYSLGYFWLVKALFGLPVRDTQTGLKLVRRDLLLKALDKTESRGFTLDLELLVRLVQLGAVMVEAPVIVQHSMKFGGIGLPVVWQIFRDTWLVWRRTRT